MVITYILVVQLIMHVNRTPVYAGAGAKGYEY